jgi:hypothetical protein
MATATSPSKIEVYRAAKRYVAAGISLIPIRADGSKMPAFELLPKVWCASTSTFRRPWGGYRERQPTTKEVRRWFRDSDPVTDYGMAVLAGKVSGNLETIDLDNWDAVEPWMDLVRQRRRGLLQRLVRVKTPRPGMHAYYRCPTIGGNQKLARIPDPEHDGEKPKAIIEIKGEGGYCLAPPSPETCHKSCRCYTFIGRKDLTMVPTITVEEREILIECARSLSTWVEPERATYRPTPRNVQAQPGLPGTDFNLRAEWADILQPHGWRWAGRSSYGGDQWTRPGKSSGISAVTDFEGSDLMFVFTDNAPPFDGWTGYTKFHAYALLETYGDFHLAAAELACKGFGSKQRSRSAPSRSFDRYAGYRTRSRRSK